MTLTPTLSALLGSVATALAIFGGGLAVEAYKRRRDRAGMALALAGAIDALLDLIETRGMIGEIKASLPELEAGRAVEFTGLIGENAPFTAITMAYARQIGDLGGALPFRVAKFLAFHEGLQNDLTRLRDNRDGPATQARLLNKMRPLWEATQVLGHELVVDLRGAAGVPARRTKRQDARLARRSPPL